MKVENRYYLQIKNLGKHLVLVASPYKNILYRGVKKDDVKLFTLSQMLKSDIVNIVGISDETKKSILNGTVHSLEIRTRHYSYEPYTILTTTLNTGLILECYYNSIGRLIVHVFFDMDLSEPAGSLFIRDEDLPQEKREILKKVN